MGSEMCIRDRLHNGTCNTAFESLGVIVLNVIIFGYHSGTQNTQNSENVRHLKWGRVERGSFGIMWNWSTSVDHNHYYQKVRLVEFFLKVFDSKIISRILGDIFANSPLLKLTLYFSCLSSILFSKFPPHEYPNNTS